MMRSSQSNWKYHDDTASRKSLMSSGITRPAKQRITSDDCLTGLIAFLITMLNLTIANGQNNPQADSVKVMTLEQCIDFAMHHQPALNRALINQAMVRTENTINLSGWLPQLSLSANVVHYYQLPTTFVTNQTTPGGAPVKTKTGIVNTAIPVFSASQTIFSPQLLHAAKNAPLYIRQAQQITDSSKVSLVTAVSKSFFNLLLTLEQVNILIEDTTRLGRTVRDTYRQYMGGIVDETDYDEAMITLNNSRAQLKQQTENIVPEYSLLKQLIGYQPDKQFDVAFDTVQMRKEIAFDTTQALQYGKRIEFQQLQTAKKLQHQLTSYYKYSILPSLSAVYNYYYEYENNSSADLFNAAYPYSYIGLSMNIPLFTGLFRSGNIRRSKLQEEDLGWAEVDLKSQIYSEYSTAMANFKSNLFNWSLLKENQARARNVYNIVALQYQQGIVAYLNLIVAESNLITAETGYINALFQLLSSKTDLEKSIGAIPYH